MITLKNVSKWYGHFQVLTDCSTEVKKGEVVVVCGPSGSGKSTLIKTVNGLEPVQQGQIIVDGTVVNDKKTNLAKLRSHVGMVFQHFELFPHLSIIDNLTLAQVKVLNRDKAASRAKGLKQQLAAEKAAAQKAFDQQQTLSAANATMNWLEALVKATTYGPIGGPIVAAAATAAYGFSLKCIESEKPEFTDTPRPVRLGGDRGREVGGARGAENDSAVFYRDPNQGIAQIVGEAVRRSMPAPPRMSQVAFGLSLGSIGVNRLLTDDHYRAKVIRQVKDPFIRAFWAEEYENYDERFKREAIAPIQNKIGQFLLNPVVRNILGQVKKKVDLPFVMDHGRLFIANLSKGQLGHDKANLLGSLLVTQYQCQLNQYQIKSYLR